MNISTLFQPVGGVALSGVPPRCFPAFLAVWGGQTEREAAFLNIKLHAARFRVCVGLLADRRITAAVCSRWHPVFQKVLRYPPPSPCWCPHTDQCFQNLLTIPHWILHVPVVQRLSRCSLFLQIIPILSSSHSGSGAHLTPWDYSFPPSFSSVYRLFSCFCKRHNFCRPLLPDCTVTKIKMA